MDNESAISIPLTTVVLDDITVSFASFSIGSKSTIRLEHHKDSENIRLFFALKGESSLILENEKNIHFDCNHHNILFIPANVSEILESACCKGCEGCGEWSFFEIAFSSEYFEKYMGLDNDIFKQFYKNIQKGEISSFCPNNLRISQKALEIIESVMQCQTEEGVYKHLFIKSQIFALIALQLQQVEHFECPALITLKKVDIDKMYQVRDFLHCNYEKSCPLSDLALYVGTNECTLKRGFKEVFGCTVHNYLSNLRMMHAKHELLTTERTITEIAEEIGYKNATHFTAAFKKKYGMLPSKLRN